MSTLAMKQLLTLALATVFRLQNFFFKLNSAENEICSAYKKLNTSNLNFLPAQQNCMWNI